MPRDTCQSYIYELYEISYKPIYRKFMSFLKSSIINEKMLKTKWDTNIIKNK
jgi:hypothetical protein